MLRSSLSLLLLEEKQAACRLLKRKRVCPPDGKDLYIGKAVQKAYLEVTEEGSEGAVGSGRLCTTQLADGCTSCLLLTEPAPSCPCQE